MESIICPNCGAEALGLIPIEPGLRLRLQAVPDRATDHIPSEVCQNCHNDLVKSSSKGAALRAELISKEQNRLNLWRTRVNLVKQAKALMGDKNFSDAAVAYEKYLRVLEIVHEKKPGGLGPELFAQAARRNEITIIASAYWDLIRIYDSNSLYADRQMKAAEKLAEFARFSSIFPDIMRRAERDRKRARNKAPYKRFLEMSNASRPRCFIATSAFDYELNDTVTTLCEFRDRYLNKHLCGRGFISAYYLISPSFAKALDRLPLVKPAVRALLRWAASILKKSLRLNHRGEL